MVLNGLDYLGNLPQESKSSVMGENNGNKASSETTDSDGRTVIAMSGRNANRLAEAARS